MIQLRSWILNWFATSSEASLRRKSIRFVLVWKYMFPLYNFNRKSNKTNSFSCHNMFSFGSSSSYWTFPAFCCVTTSITAIQPLSLPFDFDFLFPILFTYCRQCVTITTATFFIMAIYQACYWLHLNLFTLLWIRSIEIIWLLFSTAMFTPLMTTCQTNKRMLRIKYTNK